MDDELGKKIPDIFSISPIKAKLKLTRFTESATKVWDKSSFRQMSRYSEVKLTRIGLFEELFCLGGENLEIEQFQLVKSYPISYSESVSVSFLASSSQSTIAKLLSKVSTYF
jgi:hypothetical protein